MGERVVFMNKIAIYLTIFLLMAVTGCLHAQRPAPKAYTNPLIPGFFPDPSVVRVGDDYYDHPAFTCFDYGIL